MESKELKLVENNTPVFVRKQMQDLEGVLNYAKTILESGLAPDHFKKPQSIAMVLGHGLSIGMNPSQSLQQLVPINGLISIKGDGAKALIMASKLVDKWEEKTEGGLANEDYSVSITAKRKDTGEEITRTFSIAHAKRADLWITKEQVTKNYKLKYSPWWKHPDRMVYYRALGFIARDLFPDVLQGTYINEEVIDVDHETISTNSAEGKDISIDTKKTDKAMGAISETMELSRGVKKKESEEIENDSPPTPVKNIPTEEKDDFQKEMEDMSEERTEQDVEEGEDLDSLKEKIKGHGLNLPRGRAANDRDRLEDMAYNPEKYMEPEKVEEEEEEEDKSTLLSEGKANQIYLLLATSTLGEDNKGKIKAKIENNLLGDEEADKLISKLKEYQQPKVDEADLFGEEVKNNTNSTSKEEHPVVSTFMSETFDLPKKDRSFPEQQKLRSVYEEIGIDEDTLTSILIEHNIADSTEDLLSTSPYEDLLAVVKYFIEE